MVATITTTKDKWVRNVSTAGPSYEAGVRAPTKDWQARTLAAESKWFLELTAAKAAGAYGAGVREKGTAGWQQDTLQKLSRWAEGVGFASDDYEAAMRDVLGFEATIQARVLAMPDGTLAQRIARSTAWITDMSKFK